MSWKGTMPVDEQTSLNNWLLISGKTGRIRKLHEVLALGVAINVTDGRGTALMYASARGHLEFVKTIVGL